MIPTSIECLHCREVIDSQVSSAKSVDLMKKHVQKKHPERYDRQFRD